MNAEKLRPEHNRRYLRRLHGMKLIYGRMQQIHNFLREKSGCL